VGQLSDWSNKYALNEGGHLTCCNYSESFAMERPSNATRQEAVLLCMMGQAAELFVIICQSSYGKFVDP
jgi:hypothetical protein